MFRLKISVCPEDEVPDQGKAEPGEKEGGGEDEDGVAPAEIHQRGEPVRQVLQWNKKYEVAIQYLYDQLTPVCPTHSQ